MEQLILRQAAIDTEGLDEQIRCEMCRNPIHTDRGCDGNCKYDEKLYGRIMQILGERIKQLPSAHPKRGKWISADAIFGGVPFYCSECGENTRDTVMGKPRWKFCPMCGSRNEVTE